MAYKDKPLKLGRVISLKITHLKYYGNRMSLTYSSRPMIPPPLKRLFKAVGLRSAKTRCGAPFEKFLKLLQDIRDVSKFHPNYAGSIVSVHKTFETVVFVTSLKKFLI